MQQKLQRRPSAPEPQPSLRSQAYLEIKRRINRLEYRPGTYLNEAQISRQLNIGRTPVHQALDRLMLECLVQIIPRKGVVVQSISLDEVVQILEARLINEVHCIELATERATSQQITAMQALLALAEPLTRARDREKLNNLDPQNSIRPIRSRPAMLSLPTSYGIARTLVAFGSSRSETILQLHRIAEEHRAIVVGPKKRNRRQAASAMRAHILIFARTYHARNLNSSRWQRPRLQRCAGSR